MLAIRRALPNRASFDGLGGDAWRVCKTTAKQDRLGVSIAADDPKRRLK